MADYSTYGLSTDDVQTRVKNGQTNAVEEQTSRSLSSIARANIFTLFNAILVGAMATVLLVGTWKDAVFGGVMIVNAIIGIVSEWKAKRTLDALAIVDAARATVWRDGKATEIPFDDVVLDDAVELTLGDRIGVDGTVMEATGLEVDESMLTGESHPVRKNAGDPVLAGTSVVAGSGLIVATAVGEDLYAQGITRQVKAFTRTTSEIQKGIDAVLRVISFLILPVVALLAWTQWTVSGADGGVLDWRHGLVLAVAGVVGMIPQGLVLLTSMNFAVGSAKLARQDVLVQELPAVEVLARVDALCLDKTGTLTTGGIRLHGLHSLEGVAPAVANEAGNILSLLNTEASNATAAAVMDAIDDGTLSVTQRHTPEWAIAFSSARKWAALGVAGTSWYFGAPEILFDAIALTEGASSVDALRASVAEHAGRGRRVLLLAHSASVPATTEDGGREETLPADLQPVSLLTFEEDLRPDAAQTLEYFRAQGVRVRVISGDNPSTVAALAQMVGLTSPGGEEVRVCDARTLPEDLDSAAFATAIRNHDVFGRVTPEQKRAMVRALQADDHCVAMTGDGVNDALALKDADLGIAMGNGAPATKAVSQIVLVGGEFSVLPGVVAEGRRIIANMERVSSLFLTKTMYSLALALTTSLLLWPYPFLPRHFTYIGVLTIGLPAFAIALGPNKRRYVPGFLKRTLSLAIPSGIILAGIALLGYWYVGIGTVEGQSVATLSLMAGALWLLSITARPLVGWRVGLLLAMGGAAVLGFLIPVTRHFFALEWPTGEQWSVIGVMGLVACMLIEVVYRVQQHFTAAPRT
ncbi:cation-translocating P-type ATPase [Schaalia sp. Marseille-Q2122]|uniref:cation-translocating P-type ATPase n=1 Tax=Schaalia sp. Marseille-Q2122 TaxID=2736604 RepID=UPI0015884AFF|nr:cation-translocating P-type ATPase [Schaalia sp. Marseille-Q2122]